MFVVVICIDDSSRGNWWCTSFKSIFENTFKSVCFCKISSGPTAEKMHPFRRWLTARRLLWHMREFFPLEFRGVKIGIVQDEDAIDRRIRFLTKALSTLETGSLRPWISIWLLKNMGPLVTSKTTAGTSVPLVGCNHWRIETFKEQLQLELASSNKWVW